MIIWSWSCWFLDQAGVTEGEADELFGFLAEAFGVGLEFDVGE